MLLFLTVDGLNEAGLSVSVMALITKAEWSEIDYASYQEKLNSEKENYQLENSGEEPNVWAKKCSVGSIAYNTVDKKAWICEKQIPKTTMPGKQTVIHTVLMRMMLDNCANVDEALALANNYNVQSTMAESDLHILVADCSGNSKVLEWVDNKMNVIDSNHCTNYRFSADDYFHGECPRDNVLKAGLARAEKTGLPQKYGELTMMLASQNQQLFGEGNMTLFSCVYNLTRKSLKIYSFGDFDHSYHFEL